MAKETTKMPHQLWVPYEWGHRVCNCFDPFYHTTAEGFQGFVCKKCNKYFRWTLLLCQGCNNKYLVMFSHPEWCPHTARCLTCIEAGYENTCTKCTVKRPLRDYSFEADKMPRPIPNLTDLLESELTFDLD